MEHLHRFVQIECVSVSRPNTHVFSISSIQRRAFNFYTITETLRGSWLVKNLSFIVPVKPFVVLQSNRPRSKSLLITRDLQTFLVFSHQPAWVVHLWTDQLMSCSSVQNFITFHNWHSAPWDVQHNRISCTRPSKPQPFGGYSYIDMNSLREKLSVKDPDCQWNSPCQYHSKCKEESVENMDINLRV